jgi:predicted Zn-dependent protease
MKAAGYDPQGAVTLQETFVRLTQQEGAKKQSWLDGLFASHPPSAERVEQNKQTLAELGSGGEIGEEKYAARMKSLRAVEPAYAKYDQAMTAARKKDFASARSLAEEATHLLPKEGRFQELLGEISLAQKQPRQALPYYQKAIDLNSDYFGSYLGAGVAEFQAGNHARAEEWLSKSAELLPTAPAAYYLGTIARERGDRAKAMELYRAAAGSQSRIGEMAAAEFVRMDLPQNPDKYVAAAGQFDGQGRLLVVLQNRAPVSLRDFQVTPVLVDQGGRIVQQGSPVRVGAVLKPGEQVAAGSGVGNIPQAQLQYLRFRVDGARIAE